MASSRRVVIIDNDPVHGFLTREYFLSQGCDVRIFESALVALESITAASVDLVVTDLNMPGLDGAKLAGLIRAVESEKRLPRCKIIGVAADINIALKEKCIEQGMDDLLRKPIQLNDIERIVNPPCQSKSSRSIIDLKAIHIYAQGDSQVRKVLAVLRSTLEKDICALRSGDPATLIRIGHRIQGAARVVGANRLEEAAKKYEASAKVDIGSANSLNLSCELKKEIIAAIQYIDAYLQESDGEISGEM